MASVTRKYIPIFLDEVVHRKIRLYSVETGQSMADVLKPLIDKFKEESLVVCADIDEIRRKSEQENKAQQELARLTQENPLIVPGHEVDPIGQELEQPIQA